MGLSAAALLISSVESTCKPSSRRAAMGPAIAGRYSCGAQWGMAEGGEDPNPALCAKIRLEPINPKPAKAQALHLDSLGVRHHVSIWKLTPLNPEPPKPPRRAA